MEIIGSSNIIKIKEIVNASVEAEIDRILSEAKLECEKIKASSDGVEVVGAIDNISDEKKRIAEHYNSIVARSSREFTTKYLKLRNEHIDGIFEDVKSRLADFTNSDKYAQYLRKCVENEKEGYVILLSGQDMKYAEIFESRCEATDDIKIGGLMLYYKDERRILDKSFDSKLSEKRENFLDNYAALFSGGTK